MTKLHYKLIPQKDFVKAIKDILAKNNKTAKRIVYLKAACVIKDEFTPSDFVGMSFYIGTDKKNAKLFEKIDNKQIVFFQKQSRGVYIPVEANSSNSGIYSLLPCDSANTKYLQEMLAMFTDKDFQKKKIYLVVEYKKQSNINTSLNTSISTIGLNLSGLSGYQNIIKEQIVPVQQKLAKEYEDKLTKEREAFTKTLVSNTQQLTSDFNIKIKLVEDQLQKKTLELSNTQTDLSKQKSSVIQKQKALLTKYRQRNRNKLY